VISALSRNMNRRWDINACFEDDAKNDIDRNSMMR